MKSSIKTSGVNMKFTTFLFFAVIAVCSVGGVLYYEGAISFGELQTQVNEQEQKNAPKPTQVQSAPAPKPVSVQDIALKERQERDAREQARLAKYQQDANYQAERAAQAEATRVFMETQQAQQAQQPQPATNTVYIQSQPSAPSEPQKTNGDFGTTAKYVNGHRITR
jgi:hypothetical protein